MCDVGQGHGLQYVVHPACADAVRVGLGKQVVTGAAARVHGLGFQQRPDRVPRRGQRPVGLSRDERLTRGRLVQPHDHPHGRRLARLVRAEEAGHLARFPLETEVADRGSLTVSFRQAAQCDHLRWYLQARWRCSPEPGNRLWQQFAGQLLPDMVALMRQHRKLLEIAAPEARGGVEPPEGRRTVTQRPFPWRGSRPPGPRGPLRRPGRWS